MPFLYYNPTEPEENKRFEIAEQPPAARKPTHLCIGYAESLQFIQGFIIYAYLGQYTTQELVHLFMEGLRRAPFTVPDTPPPFADIVEKLSTTPPTL